MGLTQPKFAAKFGVNLHTVVNWEKGHSIPYTTTSRRLDKLLAQEITKARREEAKEAGEELSDGFDDLFDDAFDD
jgi:DNA-binding XRE family transcriptional regulator